ncbi:hypothetical protein, conserved [Entamoeba dispar SAW760]|uniref:DUF1963 domain-containing protein n=1 Tax=Entamoeba dispar (strain ATCC PRA-260 / SAW760) TaxID=370354 RepID=B0EBZ5_ENTDS|nr:uncharacterized protein EDI_215490 [Entamoeba dispar SAW760]EDR27951.1 hypothetical protein, conserved [Entamoeba dispar SAW760]|eukprot:EDR27951.1 hypothetical protein, conserved [Entamoeba dispar SAW760]
MTSNEKFEKIAKEIMSSTIKKIVRFQCSDKPASRYNCKLGGTPYLPKGFEYPKDLTTGKPLSFIMQINFEEFEALENYPTKGILQFYVLVDDSYDYGVNSEDITNQEKFRVVYFETIEKDESKLQEAPIIEHEECDPIQTPCLLIPEHREMGIPTNCYQFDNIAEKYAMKYEIDEPEKSDLKNYLYESLHVEDDIHIGGYSKFAQEDPRMYEYQDLTETLLQIGSICGNDLEYIMWGDAGFANFFISLEDLKACNFTRVGYSWDCC